MLCRPRRFHALPARPDRAKPGSSCAMCRRLRRPVRKALEELRHRLADALGIKGGIEFQASDFLLPEASGKFRLGYPQTRAV